MHPLLKYCILHTSVDNKQKGVRNKQQMHLLLEPGMGYKNLVYWSPRRAELGRCHVIRFKRIVINHGQNERSSHIGR